MARAASDLEFGSMNAEPYKAVDFELGNGRVIQVTLECDSDEVTVRLHGPKCGELVVVPSAANSIRLRASGKGVENTLRKG